MLAARGIDVSHETVRQWARKFGQSFANQIRRKLPDPGEKWYLDEVCLMIRGKKHWLWRAVDQDGIRPVYLPPYSPELQPAEHLWPVLDEPLANRHFPTLADLEQVVTARCRVLNRDQLKPGTNFHWWPKPDIPG